MSSSLHQNIQLWYHQYGRVDLPWRKTRDPYRIWVSEIMLQQTQVKTVLERFYFPFLEAFPTFKSLAQAPLDAVLKQWEGLGYYTRAHHLHKAARQLGETFPKSVEELVALPGIGPSTAHAICAFAYETPVPILDANIKRILYRFYGLKSATPKQLWHYAYELLDSHHPYEYNQAMMDIGSMLCQSKQTHCDACPLQSHCLGTQTNPLDFPPMKQKKEVPIRQRHIVIYEHDKQLALIQRKSRFLHGLWGFYEYETVYHEGQCLGKIIQKYSHFHLHATVYLSHKKIHHDRWFLEEELQTLALSSADSKVLKLYLKHLASKGC
ncbi:A/G-specific adenine glycosylase [Sulfurospirillum sp. 1612]|uniref:A/G-specific adenine glycosylase n=1 Tax=Sulfurospirillum sp. 1612 TaxID=3094835 RepID=UPI002F93F287